MNELHASSSDMVRPRTPSLSNLRPASAPPPTTLNLKKRRNRPIKWYKAKSYRRPRELFENGKRVRLVDNATFEALCSIGSNNVFAPTENGVEKTEMSDESTNNSADEETPHRFIASKNPPNIFKGVDDTEELFS